MEDTTRAFGLTLGDALDAAVSEKAGAAETPPMVEVEVGTSSQKPASDPAAASAALKAYVAEQRRKEARETSARLEAETEKVREGQDALSKALRAKEAEEARQRALAASLNGESRQGFAPTCGSDPEVTHRRRRFDNRPLRYSGLCI